MGKRISVAATLCTTLEPTIALLPESATACREMEIVTSLRDCAFEAVLAGSTERHGQMKSGGPSGLMRRLDAVVLTQASMAGVLTHMDTADGPAILSTPLRPLACPGDADAAGQ